jgi:hypothetical protein
MLVQPTVYHYIDVIIRTLPHQLNFVVGFMLVIPAGAICILELILVNNAMVS